MTVTDLIKRAAAIVGNETKLAYTCGVSQNAIEAAAMIGTSEADAPMADSIIVEGDDARPPADAPRRAQAQDSWMPDDDSFECCCPVCSSQDQ